ncbi:MAG: HAMP domain-containing histidine kinase [Alphaproteobacteria bacterium]|nr:HAMP domain-containing histidine kinase [Alphaproteobacteria bacterium]
MNKNPSQSNSQSIKTYFENYCLRYVKRSFSWLHHLLKLIKLKVMPQGLLYRFILIILLPLILLQTILFIFFYDRHWGTVSRRLALDVVGEIQTVADYIATQNPSTDNIESFLLQVEDNLGLEMLFQPNTYLYNQKISHQGATVHLSHALMALKYPVDMSELHNQFQRISVQLPKGVLTTIVPKKRFFSSTVHVFIVWMIGSSVLLFWIAFLFMKNQIRSIERLSHASELFGTGHDVQFKPGGATEVRQAGYSFILMKNRIQKYLVERTTMLAGVSHDLRTPLTRMKLQLSMMPSDETTKDLLSDVSEMEQMLNGYLAFARGEGKETPQSIRLDKLILQLVEKQKKSGQKLTCHIEEGITISGRFNDISRAICNILINANRYAQRTRINLGLRNQMATITVDDNGPGIPASKRNDVFKAFYRLEASRNPQTGGVGLGMTITRDIVLSHGGDVVLDESPMGGLRVVISLPIVQEVIH